MNLIDDIQAEAYSLGFSLFGITNLEAPVSINKYIKWISDGRHANMEYLSSEKSLLIRSQPHLLMPEAKSIIILGMNYQSPLLFNSETKQKERGVIASYAWSKDYHNFIPQKLSNLAEFLEKKLNLNIQTRSFTDSAPILEHDLAYRAGIGWIGKNTLLISPKHGSFFFLGDLFLNIELPITHSEQVERCGICQRCIQACPTGCILPDRTIDASRCISYLTIENKGSIPIHLRPQIGNRIYGCDICQLVCPWNQKNSTQILDPAVQQYLAPPSPILTEEFQLTSQEFNQRFKESPIKRAKRRGYLRNIAIALGNLAEPDTVPLLRKTLLNEQEALVRAHTAWALGQISTQKARKALDQALKQETDTNVIFEIKEALR